jgi:hypothetical protein
MGSNIFPELPLIFPLQILISFTVLYITDNVFNCVIPNALFRNSCSLKLPINEESNSQFLYPKLLWVIMGWH